MGAWGYEPYENDTALDWIAETESQHNLEGYTQLVKDASTETDENIIRAMAQTILDDDNISDENKSKLLVKLQPLLVDMKTNDSIVTWTEPEELLDEIDKQLKQIQSL